MFNKNNFKFLRFFVPMGDIMGDTRGQRFMIKTHGKRSTIKNSVNNNA